MCVVTGRHMVKEDWCICPRSRMPTLLSHYDSYLQFEQVQCMHTTDTATLLAVSLFSSRWDIWTARPENCERYFFEMYLSPSIGCSCTIDAVEIRFDFPGRGRGRYSYFFVF